MFTIGEKLKTTRPGKHLEPIELLEYPQDESICVVSHLKQYIKYTEQLRAAQHTRLLISHGKPHEPVTNPTVGNWGKSVLREAGIDTSTFSGNSARPASTSYGHRSRWNSTPTKDRNCCTRRWKLFLPSDCSMEG